MKKKITLLLCISMIASVFLHPVCAEESSSDEPYHDTLAEDLGLAKKEESSLSEAISIVNLLNDLCVSSLIAKTSAEGRLYLEEIFASSEDPLKNMPDSDTKEEISQFMTALQSLRMPEVRKERLLFSRDISLARGLKEAVGDDPASLLKFSRAFELSDLVNTGVCRSFDSVENFNAVQDPSEALFIQEETALSEEKSVKLSEAADDLLQYTVNYAKAKELPEQYVLTMEAAYELAECRNSTDPVTKLQFLKDHQETYAEYPGYYALLAEICFENKDYKQCLSAIETYEKKQGNLYEKDRVYARLIPLALICLQETVNTNITRVQRSEPYIAQLILNTSAEDWALRYFAVMAYMDIHRASNNPYKKTEYMNSFCAISQSVVRYLVHEQKGMNNDYLSALIQLKAEEGASEEDKQEIRNLNNILKEEYSSSLPPVSEALMLSIDLLQAVAKAAEINEEEITSILDPDDKPLFLNVYLDQMYRKEAQEISMPEVTYDKKKVTVPVSHLNHDYSIRVTIDRGSDHWVFTDWLITDLKRGDQQDINSYVAELTSDINNLMKFEEDMDVVVEVIPTKTVACEPVIVKYKTVIKKFLFFFKTIRLERLD